MRKLMIGASVLLALFQLWPIMFGHRAAGHAAAVAAPHVIQAAAADPAPPRLVAVSAAPVGAPKSCYRQYQAHFARCTPGDQLCHVKPADDWDLCEATGLWPQ